MDSRIHKFGTLAVILFAVLASAALYPSFFVSGTPRGNEKSREASDHNTPILALPLLSANVAVSVPASGRPFEASVARATGTVGSVPTAKPEGVPQLAAAAALVADLSSGAVRFEKNGAVRRPLASVSKLMTAAVASDLLKPDARVTVTPQAAAVDPSQPVIQAGDSYAVADLLRIMLLPSNNVAAEALAESAGKPEFMAAMNAKARAWGMADTYFDDPSGLSSANQSTAEDLVKLARHISAEYPQIFAITRMPESTVTERGGNRAVILKNINAFAGTPEFVGGKTGYTDEANGNLLSVFSSLRGSVVIVVLGTADNSRFAETRKLLGWFNGR